MFRATDRTSARGHLALPFGAFYGLMDRQVQLPGLEISVLNADPHRVVERHSHTEAHFVFVLDGLYISTAIHATPVSDGRALIFNPAGTTHRDRFEARGRVMSGQFLTVSIAAELMDAAHYVNGLAARAVALRSHEVLSLAERLAGELRSGGSDAGLRRESLALTLLTEVATSQESASRDAPSWLAIACAQLDDALGSELSIGEIARVAGVHPVHLARVFRRFMGVSPGDYLRQRRLEHARTLLRATSRPMTEIALSCGFVDQSHFTTAFRRAYRVTPGMYRQG